jgi:hypothetical protein
MSETSLLPLKEIKRFQKLWLETYGEILSKEKACVMAESFLRSVSVFLGRKIGGGGS